MAPGVNMRHTGARKFEAHPEIEKEPNPVHTGDRDDEPRIPYGLTESLDDRSAAARHHDDGQPGQRPNVDRRDRKNAR